MFKPGHFCLLFGLLVSPAIDANPMQPDNQPPPTVKSERKLPSLTAIVMVGDVKKAVFNGNREVSLGDLINGYRLVLVEPSYVVLRGSNGQKKIILKTAGAFVLSAAAEEPCCESN